MRANVKATTGTTERDQATSVYWEVFRAATHGAAAPLRGTGVTGVTGVMGGGGFTCEFLEAPQLVRDFEEPQGSNICLHKTNINE